MSEGLVKVEPAPIVVAAERSIEELVAQSQKIRQAMEQAMEVGHHYGKIPGTPKPTLLKPGAEKLCLLFRLDPQYHSEPVAPDLGAGGHLTIKSVARSGTSPRASGSGAGRRRARRARRSTPIAKPAGCARRAGRTRSSRARRSTAGAGIAIRSATDAAPSIRTGTRRLRARRWDALRTSTSRTAITPCSKSPISGRSSPWC